MIKGKGIKWGAKKINFKNLLIYNTNISYTEICNFRKLIFGYMDKKIIIDEQLRGNFSEVSSQLSKAIEKLSIDSKAFQGTYKDLQIGINASALSELSAKMGSGIAGHLQNSPLINLSGMFAMPAKTPSMTVPTLGDWYQEPKRLRFEVIIEE